jgi:hypothetical protein
MPEYPIHKTNKMKYDSPSGFIEGHILYSYGQHFPLAVRITDEQGNKYFIVNKNKYSSTTSRHQSTLRRALKGHKAIERETLFLLKIIDYNLFTLKEVLAISIGGKQWENI